MKKVYVVPAFKKSDKEIAQSYRPVAPHPACGQILEKLILNEMFMFFKGKDLISSLISLDLNMETHVSTNCYYELMHFKNFLNAVMKLKVFSLIYQKLFTRFGTIIPCLKVFSLIYQKLFARFGTIIPCLNWNKMTYPAIQANFRGLLVGLDNRKQRAL